MTKQKRTCVTSTAERLKDRDRKRREVEEKAEKEAIASEIEVQRLAAEKERKDFKTNILQYPYDIRLEAAAVAYRSADNNFTQAQLANRHVIGITSLKNKIAALKKNDIKARQDAMVAGVAVAEVLMQGSVLNLEATNEAHL